MTSEALSPAPGRRWARVQFVAYLTVTLATLAYLLWPRGGPQFRVAREEAKAQVWLTARGEVALSPDSALARKLKTAEVQPTPTSAPLLSVTGTVLASLRSGKGGRDWQFSSPELLAAYTEWQKAASDIGFTRAQLDSIRQLAEARVKSQEALVQRLARLVEAGTETDKELSAARAALLEAGIQGRKETHEAETAFRLALRTEASASRQLQQAGLEPELLAALESGGVDVVVADVPEGSAAKVKLGQGCEARFPGVDQVFTGTVRAISPVLSRERRSVRVLFTLEDGAGVLRPGMFAEVGLGTESRQALLVPAEGLLHVGRQDLVLTRSTEGAFRPTPVRTGELHRSTVEILEGLRPGDVVVGEGAILLKPLVVEALGRSADRKAGER